jgi:hypothetical protein
VTGSRERTGTIVSRDVTNGNSRKLKGTDRLEELILGPGLS